jgi:hypothetical protein
MFEKNDGTTSNYDDITNEGNGWHQLIIGFCKYQQGIIG